MINERDYMREGGERKRPGWMDWSGVKTMLIINIVVFLLCNLSNNRALSNLLGLNINAIYEGQIWRFFTYMFTHQDFSHILFNMWSLFLFGRLVEQILGKARFIQLYIFSGLIGGVIYLACNWSEFNQIRLFLLENPGVGLNPVCIGASGSVFGIMTAAAMAFPNAQMQLLFPPVPMKMRTMIIVFIVIEIIEHYAIDDNVAHMAHLGGALGAFIYMHRLMAQYRLRASARAAMGQKSWWQRLLDKLSSNNNGNPSKSYDADDYHGNKASSRLGNLDPAEVDRILDKLSSSGRSSLTPEEEEILQEASRRLRDSR